MIPIFAFEGRPETKAVIEGEFSKLEREVGTICIEGKSNRELAKSTLESLVGLYVRLRNEKPRCTTCPRTPQRLMGYEPNAEEVSWAKEQLQQRQARSLGFKKELSPGSEKVNLIESIVQKHGLLVDDRERFEKALLKYDEAAIRRAEAKFSVISKRDSFSETKRSGQYFVGIVRNVQMQIDQQRRRSSLQERYALDQEFKAKREAYRQKLEEKSHVEALRKNPEEVLLSWLRNAVELRDALGHTSSVCLEKIKEALRILIRKYNFKERVGHLTGAIMDIKDWAIEKRLELLKKVRGWIQEVLTFGLKSVTLKM